MIPSASLNCSGVSRANGRVGTLAEFCQPRQRSGTRPPLVPKSIDLAHANVAAPAAGWERTLARRSYCLL
jgi:hypothetical protein